MNLTYEERQEIVNQLLTFATEQGLDSHAYAFGFVLADVSDEVLAQYPRKIEILRSMKEMSDPSGKVSL
jgi:hypothetical protein